MKQNITKSVKEFYNDAGGYFSLTRRFIWPEMQEYVNQLKTGQKVLDVGCGNGRLLTGIKAKVSYLGIDFSKTLLNEAKTLHPKAKFAYGDITKTEVWKNLSKFDAVFCVAVLHHLPTKEQQLFVLTQIKNHLKTGGFAYISVWNLWQTGFAKHHLRLDSLFLKLVNWRWLYFPFQNRHKRFCTALDLTYLKSFAKETGFTVKIATKGKNLTLVLN
jgi:2-polyprenyl-3-methyl-5-hydroxy-6-metoxy-1,4-benzoquinol methylase